MLGIRVPSKNKPEDAHCPVSKNQRSELSVVSIIMPIVAVLSLLAALCCASGNIAQAAEDIVRQQEIAEMQSYIDEHKGELSAHERSDSEPNEGVVSDLGIRIAATDSDEHLSFMFQANRELSYLPDYIKSKFASDGWSFVITSKDLDASLAESDSKLYDPGDEKVLGLTEPSKKTVSISPDSLSVSSSCLHEMGHYVDWSLGYASQSEEFAHAVDADGESFASCFPYGHLDVIEEMYAESFEIYWKKPEALAENCPALYEYFDRF